MNAPSAPTAQPPRVLFPLRLKLTLLACFLAIVPLAVVGLLLIDVNAHAVEVLHRDEQIGGWLVIERQLTLGQLVAAEIIVTAVVAALAKVGKHVESSPVTSGALVRRSRTSSHLGASGDDRLQIAEDEALGAAVAHEAALLERRARHRRTA